MFRREHQRASQRDRDFVASRLSSAFSAGFLGVETYEHRVGKAFHARYLDELTSLYDDIARLRWPWRLRLAYWRLFGRASQQSAESLTSARSVDVTLDLGLLTHLEVVVIGRDPSCDIVLVDDAVSRRHACITFDPDAVRILDLDSTNGTYVNGTLVTRPLTLHSDDLLELGSSLIAISGT